MSDTTINGADPAPAVPNTPAPLAAAQPPRLRVLMGRYTGPRDIEGQLRLSEQLAKARTALPYRYRENPGDILALMQHATALDIELSVAWDNLIFNPDGVGGMRARMIHALLIRAGHHVQPVHVDDKIVRMTLRRGDGGPGGGAQWTLAEAIKNRLTEKDRSAWIGYAQDMLWARCISRLARRWAPEVILGFYAAEELGDIVGDGTDEGLDPADTRTAMRDADGNLTPAPDVVALLADADGRELKFLRMLWARAGEEGLMGAYAGTVDGVQLSVRDLLFDLMSRAEAQQPRTPAGVPVIEPVDITAVAAAAQTPPEDTPDGVEDAAAADGADADDETAGSGGKLSCGCWAEFVAVNGRHEPACQRPAAEQ